MQSEELDDTPPPGGGFPGPSSPLPRSPAGFSFHKRRGSSGGIGLTKAAAAAADADAGERGADGQQQQQHRRRASVSSFDDAGAALRFKLKSPRGRRRRSGGDREQGSGGKEKDEEGGGAEGKGQEGPGAAASQSGGGGGGGGDGGCGSNIEGGGGSGGFRGESDATARATPTAAAAGSGAKEGGGRIRRAQGADERRLEEEGASGAGDHKEIDAAAGAGHGDGKAEGGGREGARTARSGALRRETLAGGKHALDLASPPDSLTWCVPCSFLVHLRERFPTPRVCFLQQKTRKSPTAGAAQVRAAACRMLEGVFVHYVAVAVGVLSRVHFGWFFGVCLLPPRRAPLGSVPLRFRDSLGATR